MEISYATNTNTRVEFAMRDGEQKNFKCTNCGEENIIHVDKFYAKKSKLPFLTSVFAGIIVTIATLYFILFTQSNFIIIALGIPFVIYFILRKQDETRVSDFNRRKLKGRVHNI